MRKEEEIGDMGTIGYDRIGEVRRMGWSRSEENGGD